MKVIILLLLCFFFGFNVFGQAESDDSEITVEKISLARDDGKGNVGEETTTFLTTDIPIYCSVELSSTKSVAVKMNFVVVEANGLKAGKNIVSVSYKTNGKQNVVNFNASPAEAWAAGKYRVDILLDGKLAESLGFKIQSSTPKAKDEKTTQPKPKSSVKNGRKTGKN